MVGGRKFRLVIRAYYWRWTTDKYKETFLAVESVTVKEKSEEELLDINLLLLVTEEFFSVFKFMLQWIG